VTEAVSTDRSPNPPVRSRDVKRGYERPASFTDLLPWVEYIPESRTFLLEDGISAGALFELAPVGTEARTDAFMTQLRDAIQQGYVSYGMQTFDQSLLGLYKNEQITFEEALRQSSNPDDFKLKVSGISSTSDLSWDAFDKPGGTGEEGDQGEAADDSAAR